MRRLCCLLVLASVACGVPVPPGVEELAGRAEQGDAHAVAQLVGMLGRDLGADQRSRIYTALLQVPPTAAGAIVAAWDDDDPVRREHALALAANLRLEGAEAAALRALRDERFSRRYVAAWVLGELGAKTAAPALAEALGQGQELLARAAARALVNLGPDVVPVLVPALPSMTPTAGGYALRVLGEVGDARAVDALLAALRRPELRADAAWALGKLGRPEAGEPLRELLTAADWKVRLEAARALGLLEVAAAEPELDALRSTDPQVAVREWAARSLALLRGTPQTFTDARGEVRLPENVYR